MPEYFEFSFGLNDEGRDPRSLPDPVTVDGRFVLRGSVDLIEHRRDGTAPARHRSQDRAGIARQPDLIIGGGAVLQPVLYSVAVEQGLGKPRRERAAVLLHDARAASASMPIAINDCTRVRRALEALEIVDRAVELGRLPAAPTEGRVPLVRLSARVRSWRRAAGRRAKPDALVADLQALRAMR